MRNEGTVKLDKPTIQEWWDPNKDGPIDGRMLYQQDILDKNRGGGARRRIFVIRSGGKVIGVSEKTALTSLRYVPAGASVWIDPLGKRGTGQFGPDGKEKEQWQFEVIVSRTEKEPVFATMTTGGGDGGSRDNGIGPDDLPPPSDEDIPF